MQFASRSSPVLRAALKSFLSLVYLIERLTGVFLISISVLLLSVMAIFSFIAIRGFAEIGRCAKLSNNIKIECLKSLR